MLLNIWGFRVQKLAVLGFSLECRQGFGYGLKASEGLVHPRTGAGGAGGVLCAPGAALARQPIADRLRQVQHGPLRGLLGAGRQAACGVRCPAMQGAIAMQLPRQTCYHPGLSDSMQAWKDVTNQLLHRHVLLICRAFEGAAGV